jgi:hypothetical protein
VALIDPLSVATQGYLQNDTSNLVPITMGTLGWIKLPPERRRRVGKSSGAGTTAAAGRITYKPKEEEDPRFHYDLVIRACIDKLNGAPAPEAKEDVTRFKKTEKVKLSTKPTVTKVETNEQEYIVEFKSMVKNYSDLKLSGSNDIKILPISVLVSGSLVKK